jgi:hypothetical protein
MMPDIQNPGSALGEAIGAQMELALNSFLSDLCERVGHHFISSSVIKGKKKLLLYDNFGTAYNLDSVIANQSMQPIILIESKYIRYKKHNRDKGSWLCTAHPAVRRHYQSIRNSIAVLAGSWSSSSLAMMKSFDINIFLIPFASICDFLSQYDIKFDWGEKDRSIAQQSWERYCSLSSQEQYSIGEKMVSRIKDNLEELILSVLDESIEREIDKVTIELHSNIGEVKLHEFGSVNEAVTFLNSEELESVFLTTDSLTLFDPPPEID